MTVKALYGNVDVLKESPLIEQVGILSCRMGKNLKVYDYQKERPKAITKMVSLILKSQVLNFICD